MKTFLQVVGSIIFLCSAGQLQAQRQQACLSYEPAVVKLTGTIISRTYPGPPEYESVRKGDEPERYWLLKLASPICMNEDKPNFNPRYSAIRDLQLVFDGEMAYKRYRTLLGKRVIATGTLYAGFNIHHKTKVMLIVRTLQKTK